MTTARITLSLLILGATLGSSQAFTTISNVQNRKNVLVLGALPDDGASGSRRTLLKHTAAKAAAIFLATNAIIDPQAASALDFDAFESSQISKDSQSTNTELSDDEALCKYGAPGKAMGEACKRANMKPRLPSDVRADGKADRGDYVKCVDQWSIVSDKYVKTRVCKPIKEWGPEVK